MKRLCTNHIHAVKNVGNNGCLNKVILYQTHDIGHHL
jgi:hypothetical protein